ncbi:fimbrial protein [Burkholderia sp. Ac-20353]|uniref:fimbrial protein n=1 Tax=Burkholderia sp. Ac-20353 TaxID=2703894 RepID=UPI00197C9EC8|nr:fimbrial protein [Burkholderia sp. Ac-20353]MBN3790744.1 type 1 fimbrial protein [Burkholderia sp. Ac-20353]
MKKDFVRCCVALGIAGAVGVPSLAHAYDGQIDFTGSISDVTCNINGEAPGLGNRTEVSLGDRISPSAFTTVGATPRIANFDLKIGGNSGCTNDTKVVIDFDPAAVNINPATGNLKLVGTKPATGVEIEIKDAGNGKSGKIWLGKPQSTTDVQEAQVKNNTATLSYSAAYVSTVDKDSITTGSGNSFIRYSLAYY